MKKFSKIADTVRNPKFSSGAICAVVIVIVLTVNMIISLLGNTYGWYLYSPTVMDYSLSSKSIEAQFEDAKKRMADGELDTKVKITFCMPEGDLENHSTGKDVLMTAKELERVHGELVELRFVNIITKRDDNGAVVSLDDYKVNRDGTENRILKTTVIFECEDRFKVLNDTQSTDGYAPFYTLNSSMTSTSYNGEEILSSMVLWMTRKNHPTAYFTTGHGENSSTSLTSMLACAGYNLETINLKERAVPTDNDGHILVISNPLTDFEKGNDGIIAEIEKVEAFIRQGGDIYVALDPYIDAKQHLNIRNLLKAYGIEISTTVTEGGVTLSNIVRDTENAITTDGYTVIAGFSEHDMVGKIKENVTANGTGNVLVREAAALNLSGNAYPVLVASPSSVCEVGGSVTDSEGGYCVAAASYINTDNGGVGTLFAVSSAYLTSDDVIVSAGYSNKDFVYAVADEIFASDTPPYGCSGIIYDTEMLEGLTMGTARVYTVIASIIPAAIAIVGAIIIIRRRNR